MTNLKRLQQVKGDNLNDANFWEACKNHDKTILFATTNFNKTIGFFCPLKWMNRNYTKIPDRKSFILFFDE